MADTLDSLMDSYAAGRQPGALPPADPLDQVMDGYLDARKRQMAATVSQAVKVKPETYAEQRRIAKQLEYPVAAVEAMPDLTRQQAQAQAVQQAAASHPVIERKFTDDDFARLAHDDALSLAKLGSWFQDAAKYITSAPTAKNTLAGDVGAGAFRASRGAAGVFQAGAELVAPVLDPLESITSIGGNPLRRLAEGFAMAGGRAEQSAKALSPAQPGVIAGGVSSGVQSLTQNLLMLPLAFLPGGQAAALTGMSASAGGQSYQDAREQGLSMSQALPYATSQAVIEFATERLPLSKLLGDLKAGTPLLKTIAQQAALEIPGEQVATILQDLNDWAVLPENKDKPFSAYLAERPSAAAQTLIATVIGVGGNVAIGKALESTLGASQIDAQERQQAAQGGQLLADLMKFATESKLRERAPDAFADLVQEMAEGTEGAPAQVRFDARTLVDTLAQAGIDEVGLAQYMPSVLSQLQEALATGGEVTVPVGELTSVAGTDLEQALLQHARIGDNELSQAEAKDAEKTAAEDLKTRAQAVLEQATAEGETRASAETVKARVLEQLNTANRFTRDVNEAYATLHAAFFSTMAQREGVTPEELFNRYALGVRAEGTGGEVLNAGGALADVLAGWDAAGIKRAVHEKNGVITVSQIVVPEGERGTGKGTAAMQTLVDYADRTGQRIALTPSSDFGGTKSRLVKFYKGFGFKENKGRSRDFTISESMIREPSAPLNQSAQLPATIDVNGQQRPTTNSKGQPIAASEEGVRNFWKWFGDSKVVDDQGRPLVVYHGTRQQFDEFDPNTIGSNQGFDQAGFFFATSREEAEYYTEDTNQETGEPRAGDTPRVVDAFIRSDNPLVASTKGNATNYFDSNSVVLMSRALRGEHDAIVIKGGDGTGDLVVALSPEQIKSATGNAGTFDPANPSILKQGPRGTFNPATNTISLLQNADLSTFLHESAHFFLEVMADMAAQPGAPADIVKDMNVLLDWFGVKDTETWRAMTLEQKRKHHERFAESFEQYLIEGKAPSTELQPVFQKFRAWMLKVYKSLKDFLAGRAATPGGQAGSLEQRAYHGTPHRFDKFTTAAMGTGEGAQAFGWGLYFASKREIAEYYRRALSDGTVTIDGGPMDDADPAHMAAAYLAHANGDKVGAIRTLEDFDGDNVARQAAELLRTDADLPRAVLGGGQFYEVEVPEDSEMLDWDKPLSEQPAKVRKALARAGVEPTWKIVNADGDGLGSGKGATAAAALKDWKKFAGRNAAAGVDAVPAGFLTGQAIYRDMEIAKGSDKAASLALLAAGVKGIKFLDGTSRGAGEGSHNFVVFSDDDVAINQTFYQTPDAPRNPLGLTAEVRAVFDRMLATDEQIRAQQEASALVPLFKSAEEAGMTPEQFAAYQAADGKATDDATDKLQARSIRDMRWTTGARSKALKALQKDASEKRKVVEAEVRAEVEKEPVYQAMRWLRKGEMTTAEGEQIKAEKGFRLGTAPLAEMYPDTMLGRPELDRLKGMTAANGLHPDVVAEMFGYTGGDQLVRALLDAEPMDSVVEGMTDQRMLERYGDMATPQGIERAADEAVHNEARGRFLATELKALMDGAASPKLKGTVDKAVDRAQRQRTAAGSQAVRSTSTNTLVKAAKQFASQLVAGRKVRDLKPGQHTRAETAAAKAAMKALAKGDTQATIVAKRDEVLQHYAARETMRAQDEVQKGVDYLKKFDKDSVRKKLPPEYLDQIDKLLERVDLRQQTNRALDKRAKLSAWVKSQEELGIEPDIPDYLLEDAQLTSYRDMTVEAFRGLLDTVRQIEHLGRLKDKLLTAKDEREFGAIRDSIVASILENAGKRKANTRTPADTLGRALAGVRNFGAAHIKVATWARIMDGGKDGGPVWEYFVRSANARGDFETSRIAQATQDLSRIMDPLLKAGKLGGSGVYFGAIRRSLNREQILAIALNTGNESNLQRLLGGEGWTLDQLQPVLATLSAQDWQAVQAIWDYFETFRPEIGAKERRVFGKEPAWIEAGSPVTEALGLRGGYYPVKYDPAASQRAEEHADAEGAKRQLQGAYGAATTRRSFTKGRVEEVHGRPLLYTLQGVYSGVTDVIHDLAWHEWLIDANRLLRSQAIDSAMREKYGPEVVRQFKSWRDDIAEGDAGPQRALDTALGKLRQSVSVAGLGFNVVSAMMQPLGLAQSIQRVGAKWVAAGVWRSIGAPAAAAREVNEKSTFMRNRSRTRFRELNELRNRVEGQTAVKRAINENAYRMMMTMQALVDVPTWWGAYEKAIADGQAEDRAVALADQAVIDAQGGGQTKDLAGIERGGPALKLFTVFYSFMNTALNLGAASAMTPRSKARLAADMLLLYTVPAVLGAVLKDALTPGDAGDDDEEALARKLAAEQLSYLMGLVVLGREFGQMAKLVTGAEGAFDYKGPAGLRAITDAYAFTKQAGQGEFDDSFRKATINLAGDLFGLPSAQINRSITGTQALVEGKTSNPAAVLFGYQEPR